MKTTIKKMMRFGLKKDDIKAEFGLNEEQFNRYEKQDKYMEVDNLPELLDKYNSDKIIDNSDREKAEMFDKLFRMADKEIPNLTTEQKSGLLAAFPIFIEDVKKRVAEEEIEKLEEQIVTIKEQINAICLENGMAVKYPTTLKEREEIEAIGETLDGVKYNAFGERIDVEEQVEEKPKGKKTIGIHFGDGIRVQSPNYKLGDEAGMFSIRKKILSDLEIGDEIIVYSDKENYIYSIEKKVVTNRASYAKLKLIKKLEKQD